MQRLLDAPHFDLQVNAHAATGKIANASYAPVIPTRLHSSTAVADCFFERRIRAITRAFGSPKTPRTTESGRNLGNL